MNTTAISGTIYNVEGNPAVGCRVYVHKVVQSGTLIQSHQEHVATSDEDGVVAFDVPRNSTAWVKGNFYAGATSFNVNDGVMLAIPDAATATLESLGAAAVVPTQGLTVKSNGSALAHLIGTLDFSSDFTLTESPTGAANVSLSAVAVVSSEIVQDALATFFPDSGAYDWTYDDDGNKESLVIAPATGLVNGLMSATDKTLFDAIPSTYVPITRTVNGHALSGNISVTPTDLGLVIGTNVQAWDTDLDAIAALSPSNDDILQRKSGVWANRTIAQLKTDLSLSGTNTGDQSSVTGNAGTATALQNARTIGGVSFDGTANITVASATGGFTVSGGVLALGTNDLTMTGSLGTTGARLTKGWFTDLQVTNAIAGSITGNAATVTTNANLTGPITSSGNATAVASQTGTGTKFVMDTSPTLVTPVLGVASATSLTSPLLIGGSGTTQTLTYKTTTGTGATGADHIFQVGTNGGTEAMRILNSGFVGIGTNAANPPASRLEVIFQDDSNAQIFTTNYGVKAPGFVARHAQGTLGSPTATTQDDYLNFFGGRGHNGSAFATGSAGFVGILASQNWTTSNNGSYVVFYTTPNNSLTAAERWRIDASGNLNSASSFIGFGSATSPDLTISRNAAGIAQIGTTAANASGALLAGRAVVAKTGNYTVVVGDNSKFFMNTGAAGEVDFTLPTATAGLTFTFYVDVAQILKVIAGASTTIRIAGSVSGSAGNISNATIGGCVTLVAISATQWVAESSLGTWTVT